MAGAKNIIGAMSSATHTKTTLKLSEYIANLKYSDLPSEVVNKAKQHVLDGLGNQIAASVISQPARVVHDLLEEWGGRGQATVVGYGTRLPVAHTAMVNAMMGHGVELDDAHGNALTKAGSVLIPVANAVGEMVGASGEELITALVVGYDTTVRIGLSVQPSHRTRGFHTTGTAGTFGAAAVTAKLLGLNAEGVAWALGLAGIQAAAIQAFLDDPCMAKPFSPGKAAFNGVLAGLLASRGFTGPRYVLESREGFFRAFSDQWDEGVVTEGLGSEFKIMEMGFKPHAACRYAHGPIDNAQAIHRRHEFKLEDVESVTVGMSELAIRQANRVKPPTLNSAMGSTQFGVALALVRGANGLRDYWEGFKDPKIHELSTKITLQPWDVAGYMGRQSWVRVRLKDGREFYQASEAPKGEPSLPLTSEEIVDKFRGLASFALDEDQVEKIISMVERLETLEDVGALNRSTVARERHKIDPLA